MGCRKLTYYREGEALAKKENSFLRVVGKKSEAEKKCINYYPFGMQMPGRTFSNGQYRWGFNGYENDNEVKGNGNSIDFGARVYDPRISRFFSPDPKEDEYTWQSTYVFAANNPVLFVDVNGEGPGDKCEGCGSASEKNVGDQYYDLQGYYAIQYEVFEENGVKFWDIVESHINLTGLAELPEEESKAIMDTYRDKTNYVKVQDAYPDNLANRFQKHINPFDEQEATYEIDGSDPSLWDLTTDVLSPFDSGSFYKWSIDNEGFIKVTGDEELIIKSSLGSLKLLTKGKPIWKMVRSGELFTNGSKLQKMISQVWKQGYYKNGSVADQLLFEFKNGLNYHKHLKKTLDYRKALTRAVRGRKYGKLSSIQKQFLIRELRNMQNVLTKITTK